MKKLTNKNEVENHKWRNWKTTNKEIKNPQTKKYILKINYCFSDTYVDLSY